MDRLDVTVHRSRDAPDGRGESVALRVNGRDLLELVREAELPFASAEGHPELAGAYAALPAGVVLPPSRHLLGEPAAPYSGGAGKAALLECECGEPGCWPLLARIDLAEKTVTWRDFEQPHRSGEAGAGRPGPWRYDGLGPFVFGRAQYEAALAQAAAGAGGPKASS